MNKLSWGEFSCSSRAATPWVFVRGLPYQLTEGDIITVFSQFGEVVAIHLVRAGDSGTSRGICYLCYHDRRSAILAVDNFSGSTLLRRTLQVQHVECYSCFDGNDSTCPSEERLKQGAVECAPKPIVRRKRSRKCRTK